MEPPPPQQHQPQRELVDTLAVGNAAHASAGASSSTDHRRTLVSYAVDGMCGEVPQGPPAYGATTSSTRCEADVLRSRAELMQCDWERTRRERALAALGAQPRRGARGVVEIRLRSRSGREVHRRFRWSDELRKVFEWAEAVGVDIHRREFVDVWPHRVYRHPEHDDTTIGEADLYPPRRTLLVQWRQEEGEGAGR